MEDGSSRAWVRGRGVVQVVYQRVLEQGAACWPVYAFLIFPSTQNLRRFGRQREPPVRHGSSRCNRFTCHVPYGEHREPSLRGGWVRS